MNTVVFVSLIVLNEYYCCCFVLSLFSDFRDFNGM